VNVQEEVLRELATSLRGELEQIIGDEDERMALAAELDAALALPAGEAGLKLIATLRARPQAREWVATRIDAGEPETWRMFAVPPGVIIAPLRVHVVCPRCDYDRFFVSPGEDFGRCPRHGLRLVPAED